MNRIAVIMAGGAGERFWPVSRRTLPKQLLRLTGDATMLAEAVERVLPLFGADRVLIATSALLAPAVRDALPMLPPGNIIGEPAKRNTSGCLTLAAAHAARFSDGDPGADGLAGDDVVMAILTADHAIGEVEEFRATLDDAMRMAEAHPAIVTLGIEPTRAEVGYGYIEMGDAVAGFDEARHVLRFREKPDVATARDFVESGRFLWNSGMFFWRASTFRAALDANLPDHATALRVMARSIAADPPGGDPDVVNEAFEALTSLSIDVGVLEHARNVMVRRARFPWDDVGEWSALLRLGHPDADGNVIVGDAVLEECRESIAYNTARDGRLLTAMGLNRQVVVQTDDVTMVVPVDEAQRVKELVNVLRARQLEKYL
jgi:mannose-1-phosphate guanylyltransferase